MKTWAKFAIGCLVVLVILCLVLAVVFFVGGSWLKNKVGGFFGGAVKTGQNVVAIEKLDQQYPFSEPQDGIMQEGRLKAFVGICQKVKTAADPYQEELSGMEQGSDNKDMAKATKMVEAVSAISTALKEGLEAAKMSPSEYRWLQNTAYSALETGGESGGNLEGLEGFQAMTKASLDVLEPQLNDPSLTAEQRQALQDQIAELKAQLGSKTPSPGGESGNAALAAKYKEQLESNDVRSFVEMGLSGQGLQHKRPGISG